MLMKRIFQIHTRGALGPFVKKKKKVVVEASGQVHIHSSFNNIIISLTNNNGQVISWSSAGKMGFRGSKKNTPYAAQLAAEDAVAVAKEAGLKKVKAYVNNSEQILIESEKMKSLKTMEEDEVELK